MGDTNELKPCPFCGGKGNASERTCDKDSRYNPNDRAYPVVRCSVCFTTVGGKDWSGISTAIEAWNKRATATPPAGAALAELLLRLEIQSTNNHVAKDKRTASADYCEGIAKGFDECLRIVKKHAAALRARAVPQSAPAGFVEWLCQEMPPGTVISDPAWWAPKIHRAMLAASKEDGK